VLKGSTRIVYRNPSFRMRWLWRIWRHKVTWSYRWRH